MSTSKSKPPSRQEAQRHPEQPNIGENYQKLEEYVTENFPHSNANWSFGVPDIPHQKFQVHIIYRKLRTERGGIKFRTRDASSVDDTAKIFLEDLKKEEEKGLKDLNHYIEKNFAKYGYIVEHSGNRQEKYRNTTTTVGHFEKFRVSVLLNEELVKNHGKFILGAEYGATIGIAARKVLELIQFKKEKGFLWVNERLFDHAEQRFAYAVRLIELDALEKLEKKKKDKRLNSEPEQREISKMLHELEKPLMWLGGPFWSKPSFFKGDLPKMSQKLHKVLQKNSKEPKRDAKNYTGAHLLTYDAVEAYEVILKQEPKKTTTIEKVKSVFSFIKKIKLDSTDDAEGSKSKDKGTAKADDPASLDRPVAVKEKANAAVGTASTSKVVDFALVKSKSTSPNKMTTSKGMDKAEVQKNSSRALAADKGKGKDKAEERKP